MHEDDDGLGLIPSRDLESEIKDEPFGYGAGFSDSDAANKSVSAVVQLWLAGAGEAFENAGKILLRDPDLFYDRHTLHVYLIAGSDMVNVYSLGTDKTLKPLDSLPTAPGAKTGLFVPALHELFVALPAAAGRAAEIRVYSTAE